MENNKALEPKILFDYFMELCAIPHGSGNMQQISDYIVSFAEKNGFEFYRDDTNNVVIISDATAGREDEPAIMLQGHMDMVCALEEGKTFDFLTQKIDVYQDNGYLRANGTSLGGDDGVAVAAMMAILTDKTLSHPRLECVFTTDEETGLIGANGLDVSHLKAKYLINIDSEEEGVITVGCAGGTCMTCTIPSETEITKGPLYTITVDKLLGGHSGTEIIKQRANANIIIGRILYTLKKHIDYKLVCANGGMYDNAIPRKASALIVSSCDKNKLSEIINNIGNDICNEYVVSDPDMRISLEVSEEKAVAALTDDCTDRMITALYHCPDGIQRMSDSVDNMVETSLNLGILNINEISASYTFMLRSMVNSAAENLNTKVASIFESFGGKATIKSNYNAWEYKQESPLRDHCVKVFESMYSKKPVVGTIHAGLESAIIADKFEYLDCVSIGPDLANVHTSEECLDIASTARTYEYIRQLIERKI